MYRRRRWLVVVAAVVLVGTVEVLSDTASDAFLPFPFHVLPVLAVVSVVVGTGAWYAFRRIDRLAKDLEERNTALAKKKSLDDAQEKLLTTEAEIARLEEELARLKGASPDKSTADNSAPVPPTRAARP